MRPFKSQGVFDLGAISHRSKTFWAFHLSRGCTSNAVWKQVFWLFDVSLRWSGRFGNTKQSWPRFRRHPHTHVPPSPSPPSDEAARCQKYMQLCWIKHLTQWLPDWWRDRRSPPRGTRGSGTQCIYALKSLHYIVKSGAVPEAVVLNLTLLSLLCLFRLLHAKGSRSNQQMLRTEQNLSVFTFVPTITISSNDQHITAVQHHNRRAAWPGTKSRVWEQLTKCTHWCLRLGLDVRVVMNNEGIAYNIIQPCHWRRTNHILAAQTRLLSETDDISRPVDNGCIDVNSALPTGWRSNQTTQQTNWAPSYSYQQAGSRADPRAGTTPRPESRRV